MAPLTYEQVSIYFRARTRRAQDPREDFILYIYSTLAYLIMLVSSSSYVIADKSQMQDEYQFNRHNNASHPCYINFLLITHDILRMICSPCTWPLCQM